MCKKSKLLQEAEQGKLRSREAGTGRWHDTGREVARHRQAGVRPSLAAGGNRRLQMDTSRSGL